MGEPRRVLSKGRDAQLVWQSGVEGTLVEAHSTGQEAVDACGRYHEEVQDFVRGRAPALAQLVSRRPGQLTFACEAAVAFSRIIDAAAEGQLPKLSYPQAAALIQDLLLTIDAVHNTSSKTMEANASYFRYIGPGNLLVNAEGELKLFGLGGLRVAEPTFAATRVEWGGEGSIGADIFAGIRFSRWVMPAVDLPRIIQRIYVGDVRPEEELFRRYVVRVESVLASPNAPTRRLRVGHLLTMLRTFWLFMKVKPDREGLRGWLHAGASLLGEPAARATYDPQRSRLELPGEPPLEFARKPVQSRLMAALIDARMKRPGACLSAEELIGAGWPGERIRPNAAKNRLHVALSGLRKQGLEPWLEHDARHGYRLATTLVLSIHDST